jgi:phosphoadenosine phosphosulfate reductase
MSEKSPQEILRWSLEKFQDKIALACSFSPEDIALIHMGAQINPNFRVFSLDTGRLNEETYECADAIRRYLGVQIEWYFPRREEVESLERAKGLFSFKQSPEARKECCFIRKVEPLRRALSGLDAWITGLRADQSVTRTEVATIETDAANNNISKINPLIHWSSADAWDYIRRHNLPYNKLHDKGYTSIGCAPCTRAIVEGEDERAGRWWWESPEHKECGLHIKPRFSEGGGI